MDNEKLENKKVSELTEKEYLQKRLGEIIENEENVTEHIRKIIKRTKYSYKLFGKWQLFTKEAIENDRK